MDKRIIVHSLLPLIFISILIFAQKINAQEQNLIFDLKFKSNWELSCSDFVTAKFSNSEDFLKFESLKKTLSNKYALREAIFREYAFDRKSFNLIKVVTSAGTTMIAADYTSVFCQDWQDGDDQIIIVETEVIPYFEISGCTNNEPIEDIVFLKKINEHIDLKKIISYDGDEIILTNTAEDFLLNDIYYYNDKGSNIRCVIDYPIKFSVKYINSYLSNNNTSKKSADLKNSNGAATEPSDKPAIQCNALDENEILNHPVVCKDVIDQRKKEGERKKEELKNAEIKEITEILNTFLSKSTSGEWQKRLTDDVINEIINEINNLEKDYQTLKNKKLLEDRLKTITELHQAIDIIFYHHNFYANVCIHQDYQFINSEPDDYASICASIDDKKSDLQWLDRKISSWNLGKNSNFIRDYDLLKVNVAAEIAQITEEEKQEEVEKKSISEVEEQIDPLITQIKNDIRELENRISDKIQDLNGFIKNFDINKPYSESYDELEGSISREIKKIDNLFIKIGNLINKFPENYDSSSYQQQQSIFSRQIGDLNAEKDSLVERIHTAQSKLKEQADKKLKDDEKQKVLDQKKKEEKEKALAEANLKKLEGDIDEKISEIEVAIKDIKKRISDEIQVIEEFVENFNPRETYTNNYDNLENEILDQKDDIKSLIDELSTLIKLIKKLPKDYDTEDYDDERSNAKRDLKYIDIETLNEKIKSAKSLIDSQDERIGEILQEQDKLITQLRDKLKILEDNKTTSEKDLLEKLTTSEKVNEELNEELKDDIETRQGTINNLNETIEDRKTLIIILIVILVILLGLIIYLFVRRKSSRDDDASVNTRKYLSRIEALESELENQNASLRSQVKTTDAPVLDREQEKKEVVPPPPPDPQKEKYNNLMKLYKDYDDAMKDPNKVEVFMKAYNAEGLEREARLASKGKTTLRKVNKPFNRADFWLVQHDNKWLIFGGRILKVQAPSFLADDGTRARNLMQGIFQLEFGIDFKTVRCAIVNKINQIYEVRTEGKLQLPKTDS